LRMTFVGLLSSRFVYILPQAFFLVNTFREDLYNLIYVL
jgi:hypothetical protein